MEEETGRKTSMKMDYKTIIAVNLARADCNPGDEITMMLRNEVGSEGMYALAKRLNTLFLNALCFWPDAIRMHPDHITLLKKQGKTLDIILNEQMSQIIGKHIDLTDLPTGVPFIADEKLDLFTAVATFHFSEERGDEFIEAAERVIKNMF
jgi:hypothetical protein